MLVKAKYMDMLPKDFDGVFRFTNYRDTEFKAKWNNVEYTFPPMSTSPMIIAGATPEEVQHIRKKFAKEFAVEEWYKTSKFQNMNNVPMGGTPSLYTDSDLAPFIQKCLEPLPVAHAEVKVLPKDDTKKYRASKILKEGESLMSNDSGQVEI